MAHDGLTPKKHGQSWVISRVGHFDQNMTYHHLNMESYAQFYACDPTIKFLLDYLYYEEALCKF